MHIPLHLVLFPTTICLSLADLLNELLLCLPFLISLFIYEFIQEAIYPAPSMYKILEIEKRSMEHSAW